MKKVTLSISGMSCSACQNSLEKYLNKQPGVIKATVNLVLAQAQITYDDNLTIKDLEKYVAEAGFKSEGVFKALKEKKPNSSKALLIIYTFLALLVFYIGMHHMFGLPAIPFLNKDLYPFNYALSLLILVLLFFGYGHDILINGLKNIIHLRPNMDSLVATSVLASFIYSLFNTVLISQGNISLVNNLYYESCCIIIYFIKLGRLIEAKSKEKTKDALQGLVQITPKTTLLKTKDGEKEVTIDEIKKGDILIAKPGMKIAVDGQIIEGQTHLDEAFITGEANPVKKRINDSVIAGSINIDGFILYKALKIGKDSLISEIVHLVVEAANTKVPMAKIIDKVSSIFVPTIFALAILTFLGYLLLGQNINEALIAFTTVLVIACPCALGLAAPLAVVVSTGLCAKEGILIKDSATFEKINQVDTIVFDKTGTLTEGALTISKIFNYSKLDKAKILQMVASLESYSTHPIAQTFNNYVQKQKIPLLPVTNFKNLTGIGLQGQIDGHKIYVGNNKLFKKLKMANPYSDDEQKLTENSLVYLIKDQKVLALIGIKDALKPSALKVVKKLQKINKKIIMLTGDNENVAKAVAHELGIKNVTANVLPKEKNQFINTLKENGAKIMMVGDGINDAIALTNALVGVSLNKGTDIANDAADVILMHDDLTKIVTLIAISKRTVTNIKQNLFWAFFYNALMIPLAMGLFKPFNLTINPMLASIAMILSSLTVILNTLRIKYRKTLIIKTR